MFFLPLSLILLVLFILFLPVLFFFLHIHIAGQALRKLGISANAAVLIIFLCLIGSTINIPLTTRPVESIASIRQPLFNYQGFPDIEEKQTIAINVGGAIIPLLICLYLLRKAPLVRTIIATIICSLIVYKLARPVPMVGVTVPVFIPPLTAATLALILSPRNPTPVAYISGVLGVIIGADLMNLNCLSSPGIMSIGGAGVFDGIFMVGIISALLG
jgi:uncharacterized membrane protein